MGSQQLFTYIVFAVPATIYSSFPIFVRVGLPSRLLKTLLLDSEGAPDISLLPAKTIVPVGLLICRPPPVLIF